MLGLDVLEHITTDGVHAVQTPLTIGNGDDTGLNLIAFPALVVQRVHVQGGVGGNGKVVNRCHDLFS